MPILLKRLDGSIISLFGDGDTDHIGEVKFIKSFTGAVGYYDYILLNGFEAFTQNFTKVIDSDFCQITPNRFGANGCVNHTNLTISY